MGMIASKSTEIFFVSEVDVNSAWETIKENISISAKENLDYYELKHKLRFSLGCS
jgi:hypothetical protein